MKGIAPQSTLYSRKKAREPQAYKVQRIYLADRRLSSVSYMFDGGVTTESSS